MTLAIRTTKLAAVAAGTAVLSLAGTTIAPSAVASARAVASSPETEIAVDSGHVLGTLNRGLFGANETWPSDMAGAWNPAINAWSPAFGAAVDGAGLTALRYPGGTAANTFHWRNAIGPQDQRLPQLSGTPADPEPSDSVFGPDEFGKMIEQHHLQGNIVVNFATGTAQEAADWVSYMTATSGPFAALRARNGHPAPYDIPYWEVGNEIGLGAGQSYWLAGEPTAADIAAGCTTDACLYTFGGTTAFTDQGVGSADDHRPAASLSTGKPNQSFQVQYAPIVPGTATVKVGGTAWTEASRLEGDTPTYSLDAKTGVIQFGDGVNGEIPPAGAQITISYDSGPHDGFAQFYTAMKTANPNVNVCSGFAVPPQASASVGTDFLQHAPHYDCVVAHPYVSGPPSTLPLAQYYPALMLKAENVGTNITSLQQQVRKYQPNARVIVTEYGQLGSGGPTDFPTHFHLTLSEALFTANALVNLADADVPLAERHRLNDYVFTPLPGGASTSGAVDNSMIATDPGSVVSEPQASVMGLFSRDTGKLRLADTVTGNPVETSSQGDLPSLVVLASRRTGGSVNIIVINRSPDNNVTAAIAPTPVRHASTAQVLTVNGPSATSYNTAQNPDAVKLQNSEINVGTGTFTYTFPAHSVTGFTLTTPSGP